MKQITYTVIDPLGIHARPAGLLVKMAKELPGDVQLIKDGRAVDARKLFAVMGLAVKQNDEISFTFTGGDEDAAAEAMLAFLKDTL